jgi:hypothetical protein
MSNIATISAPAVSSGKWLFTDVIAKNRLSIIVGVNHTYNGEVANMISRRLVTGEPMFDKKVCTRGSVLYAGKLGKNRALTNSYEIHGKPHSKELLVMSTTIDLLNQQKIIDVVGKLNERGGLIEKGLSLIVFELSTYKSLDPVDAVNVSKTVSNLNYILENTGVSILLVQSEGSARRPGIRVLIGMANVAIKIRSVNYWKDRSIADLLFTKVNDRLLKSPRYLGRLNFSNVGEQ